MSESPPLDAERLATLLVRVHESDFFPPDEVIEVVREHCRHLLVQAMLLRSQGKFTEVTSGPLTPEEQDKFVTLLMMGALIHGWQAGVAW